jgi:hypothetical protein
VILVGTCSLCSGPVARPESWSGTDATRARCMQCFAVPLDPFGPRVEMTRRAGTKEERDEPWDAG